MPPPTPTKEFSACSCSLITTGKGKAERPCRSAAEQGTRTYVFGKEGKAPADRQPFDCPLSEAAAPLGAHSVHQHGAS